MFWLSVSHGPVERRVYRYTWQLGICTTQLRCCLGQLYSASRATNVRPNPPVEMVGATSLYELLIIRPMNSKGTTGVWNHPTKPTVRYINVCPLLSLMPSTSCGRCTSSIASAHALSPRPTYCPTIKDLASTLAVIFPLKDIEIRSKIIILFR